MDVPLIPGYYRLMFGSGRSLTMGHCHLAAKLSEMLKTPEEHCSIEMLCEVILYCNNDYELIVKPLDTIGKAFAYFKQVAAIWE